MQQFTIKQDELLGYTKAMIRYAVFNHTAEIVELLQQNGINVPAGASSQTILVMTLHAMISSDSFRSDLSGLLHNIAMEGQYSQYKAQNFTGYYNQSGTASTPTPPACTCCSPSWFSQTFNPKTVDTVITSGLTLLTGNLAKGGNAAVANAAKPPITAQQPSSNTGVVVLVMVVLVIGAGGYFYWKSKHKK